MPSASSSHIRKAGAPLGPILVPFCQKPPYPSGFGLSPESRLTHLISGEHLHRNGPPVPPFQREGPELIAFPQTCSFSRLFHFCSWYQNRSLHHRGIIPFLRMLMGFPPSHSCNPLCVPLYPLTPKTSAETLCSPFFFPPP